MARNFVSLIAFVLTFASLTPAWGAELTRTYADQKNFTLHAGPLDSDLRELQSLVEIGKFPALLEFANALKALDLDSAPKAQPPAQSKGRSTGLAKATATLAKNLPGTPAPRATVFVVYRDGNEVDENHDQLRQLGAEVDVGPATNGAGEAVVAW